MQQLSISLNSFVPSNIQLVSTASQDAVTLINEEPQKRALILARGKGVRLAPLTEVIPKPLVPIGGKPILELVIKQLAAHGFQRITLAVGYISDLLRSYFDDGSRWGVQVDYSFEDQPLGTAGPLALISGLKDTFLVMNADVLTDINYNALLDYHKSQGAWPRWPPMKRQLKMTWGSLSKMAMALLQVTWKNLLRAT